MGAMSGGKRFLLPVLTMKRFAVSWPLGMKRFGLNATSPISIKGKASLAKRCPLLVLKRTPTTHPGLSFEVGKRSPGPFC